MTEYQEQLTSSRPRRYGQTSTPPEEREERSKFPSSKKSRAQNRHSLRAGAEPSPSPKKNPLPVKTGDHAGRSTCKRNPCREAGIAVEEKGRNRSLWIAPVSEASRACLRGRPPPRKITPPSTWQSPACRTGARGSIRGSGGGAPPSWMMILALPSIR